MQYGLQGHDHSCVTVHGLVKYTLVEKQKIIVKHLGNTLLEGVCIRLT